MRNYRMRKNNKKKINLDDIKPSENISSVNRLDKLKELLTPYSGDPTDDMTPVFKNDQVTTQEIQVKLDDTLNTLDLTEKQLLFIQNYHKFNYHIGKTCEFVGVHRQSYYDWLKNPNFKMACDCLHEAYIDDAVACVNRAIGNDNVDAAKFVLKTLGKRRGFAESMDITTNGESINVPIINIITPKQDE